MADYISIKGARVNNLKNVDVDVPRGGFVVITGLSGSGKSSLAFDTLYAEGQRRYVESLSSYARQFLGKLKKPECDFIRGLPPAIAIEQRVARRNPRSTVGTTTEISDYLRMMFARIGRTYSPVSGMEVRRYAVDDVVNDVMSANPPGTRFMVLAPIVPPEGRDWATQLGMLAQQGFSRVERGGHVEGMEDCMHHLQGGDAQAGPIRLLVDRMAVSRDPDGVSRLTDSVQTAFFEGHGECIICLVGRDGSTRERTYSTRFEADGIQFGQPSDQLFSFNSPAGACPTCEGFGMVVGIDERLVIPDTSLSIYEGAVYCWRGEKMDEWREAFIRQAVEADFPIFEPYYNLSQQEKDYLWHGPREKVCIDSFFEMLRENQYKVQYRVMLARFRGKTTCPDCHGGRLRKEAGYVKVGGKDITQLSSICIDKLRDFFRNLQLTEHEMKIAGRLLTEIRHRLDLLMEVGLGYLTLNRMSNTLSGGESQRISLVTSLGSSLVGSLYVLDEPSIGLHSRDTGRLIKVLRQLQSAGNTVVVVEHDEEIIRAADHIIDIGPKAGRLGGEVVYQGSLKDLPAGTNSLTVKYLNGEENIAYSPTRRPWHSYIMLEGCRENNLKGIDVAFPLNVLTVVTGVSGSGKSTLVRQILYQAVLRALGENSELPGMHKALKGDVGMVKHVEFVDQNPLGRSTRSNPVTYVKAYDEIRKLFAAQPLARQMGHSAGEFSFNSAGGRCEECKGEGFITVEMQFMADLVLTCEACHGKRFKNEILEVTFQGKNIHDVLEMTISEAMEFFEANNLPKIVRRLKPLQDVGLGYVKLGQSSSTLSGGESQRVKLAYYLSQEMEEPTLFIFDEPTTGLHLHDINALMKSFNALIAKGHTVVVIEHNMDVIKCADHIIDLGPEGGDEGGYVVASGTPEQVAECEASHTGRFLKKKLNMK